MAALVVVPRNSREALCAVLMCRIQAGDTAAFEEFVRLTRSRLMWEMYLYGLDNPHDREDCLQGIYVEFWERRRRVWPEKAVGYLMRIASARIRDFCRELASRPDRPVKTELQWHYLAADPAPGPECRVIDFEAAAEARRRCKTITAAVPAHLQPALTCYLYDVSPQETARRLGLTLTQVWDRIIEALSIAKSAAGAPPTNRELEVRLAECGLWPAGAAPLPIDIGQVLRRLPEGQRTIIYCRLTGLNTVETARTLGLANVKSLTHIARSKLRLIAQSFGVLECSAPIAPWADVAALTMLSRPDLKEVASRVGVQWTIEGIPRVDLPAVWSVAVALPSKKGGRRPRLKA